MPNSNYYSNYNTERYTFWETLSLWTALEKYNLLVQNTHTKLLGIRLKNWIIYNRLNMSYLVNDWLHFMKYE